MSSSFWKGRSVFITGHTGFKGGWLSLWLTHLGAKVHGFSLDSTNKPGFYAETNLQGLLESSTIGDVRDLALLTVSLERAQPSLIIHMAAQSLVIQGYKKPVDTFSTNLLGTVTTLEAARHVTSVKAIINVTTDKCYENTLGARPFGENDRLGGHDPYSSSKACAELATAAYRKSFLAEAGIQLASVRAGNVVGGGDWAMDRLIPDFLRAADANQCLTVRFPAAVRPWQHVLEPLSGYLLLAENLLAKGGEFSDAWNFGPDDAGAKTVSWVADFLCQKIPGASWQADGSPRPHEDNVLKLDSTKARIKLGWSPRWSLDTALIKTVEWHQAWKARQRMCEISIQQIEAYQNT